MNKSGIYQIINILNGDIYVGSAILLSSRKCVHFKSLKENKHHSIKLQRAWNKYGEENFIFEILELVGDKNNLISREQYYIDTLKPKYNICKTAGSSLGYRHTSLNKKKMSQIQKKRVYKQTKESINKGLETKKRNGRWFPSKESRAKTAAKLKGNKHPKEVCDKNSFSMKRFYEKSRRGCNYCGKVCSNIKGHELRCKSNPNRVDIKFAEETRLNMSKSHLECEKLECEYCLKNFDHRNYKNHHGENCKQNKNRPLIECPKCLKMIPNSNSRKYHFDNCKYEKP